MKRFLCVFLFVSCLFAQPARVEVSDGFNRLFPPLSSGSVGPEKILSNGPDVPEGYVLLRTGKFRTGPLTIHCGEDYMISKIADKCKELGATHFRIYNVREPNLLLSTCWGCDILFLRKEP